METIFADVYFSVGPGKAPERGTMGSTMVGPQPTVVVGLAVEEVVTGTGTWV